MEADQLVRDVKGALENDPRINLHRDRIDIELDGGVPTLSGEVDHIAAKRRALAVAAAVTAAPGIVDRLRVRPAELMGDGAIADHVEQALMRDSAFDQCALYRTVRGTREIVRNAADGPYWIEIAVDDGVVTLTGDVPSLSHKRLAGVLAWWVPGSRDVVNGLGVEPDEDDNDLEILDALRIVLEKDPLVDASQINPSCRGSAVTLDGFVSSAASRSAAEYDAWALVGVSEVINRIEVANAERRR